MSPRVFEAAAVRSCQILFEGRYSGILEPMVHYIPLKKDFSNFEEVLRRYRDESIRRELTENAHRDLIASGGTATNGSSKPSTRTCWQWGCIQKYLFRMLRK